MLIKKQIDDEEDPQSYLSNMLGMQSPQGTIAPKQYQFEFTDAETLLNIIDAKNYIKFSKLKGNAEIKKKVVMKLWTTGLLDVKKIT